MRRALLAVTGQARLLMQPSELRIDNVLKSLLPKDFKPQIALARDQRVGYNHAHAQQMRLDSAPAAASYDMASKAPCAHQRTPSVCQTSLQRSTA